MSSDLNREENTKETSLFSEITENHLVQKEDESDKKEEEEVEDDEIEDSLMHMKMNLTRRHSIAEEKLSTINKDIQMYLRLHSKISQRIRRIAETEEFSFQEESSEKNVRVMNANGEMEDEVTNNKIEDLFAEPEFDEDDAGQVDVEGCQEGELEEDIEDEEETRSKAILVNRWRRVSIF